MVDSRSGPAILPRSARGRRSVRRRSGARSASAPAASAGGRSGTGRTVGPTRAAAGSRCRSSGTRRAGACGSRSAAAHWSAARTVPRILSVTPDSARAAIALDARRLEDAPAPDRVGGHRPADLVDDLDRRVDVGPVGDGHVLVDARPDAGQVRGDLDLAVGDGVDDAVEVAQRRPAQGEVLDRARRPRPARTTSPLANWFSIRISAPLR